MIEAFMTYMRTRWYLAPEIERRYYRLFGDLEYDLLALKVEWAAMDIRVREVRRRVAAAIAITAHDEREINAASHEMSEHLYAMLERLHARIAAAKRFRYDPESEAHGWFLLRDIATAVLGLRDATDRERHRGLLDAACEAYARGDVATLMDHHEAVQPLVACERRDSMTRSEQQFWGAKLQRLLNRHPVSRAALMDSPEGIADRANSLKRRVETAQARLEWHNVAYTAAIAALRFRN